jgi:tetratricopeptide (TPR) repeat protein
MKNLIAIATLAFLGACASNPHQNLAVDQQSGLFKDESLWRVAGREGQEAEWLRGCYQGDLKGFTQKAREEYQKGAKTARYWTWVGNCLAWHNELREARFFLGMAQELAKTKEDNAMVKNNLAVVYIRQGRVSRAYDVLVEARELAPHFITPAFNLAQLYVGQNLNQEALKILNHPPFEKSSDAEILHLKGLAYVQLGQVKQASPFLSQIPPKLHSREDFALTLAKWHLLEGRPAKTLELLNNYKATGLSSPQKLAERLEREANQQLAALEAK